MTDANFAFLDPDAVAAHVAAHGWHDVEVVRCRCGMPGCQTAIVIGLAARADLMGLAETGQVHEFTTARTPPAPPAQRFVAMIATIVVLPHPPVAMALEPGERIEDAVLAFQRLEDPHWLVITGMIGALLQMGLRDAIDTRMRTLLTH